MSAGHFDILIEQGSTFTLGIQLKKNKLPINLTGYTGVCKIKHSFDDINALVSPTVTFDTDRTTGKFVLSISASVTKTLTFFNAYYDIELTDSGGITSRILQGKVTLSKGVTK